MYLVKKITVVWNLTPSSVKQRRCYIPIFSRWSKKSWFILPECTT